MLGLIKRQKRRLGLYVLAVCLPLAIWAAVGGVIAQVALRDTIILTVGLTLCLCLFPILLLRFAPSARNLLEMLAMIVPAASALGITGLLLGHLPYATPICMSLTALVSAAVLSGRVLPHLIKPRDYVATHKFQSAKSVYTLWAEHLPDPGLVDRHWCQDLENLTLIRLEPHVRIATYSTLDGPLRQELVMTTEDTHNAFSYDFTELLDDDAKGATGSYGMAITDHNTKREVTLSLTVHALPFQAWLGVWLDDLLGDEGDHHVARETGRKDCSITSRNWSRPQGKPQPAADPELATA